MLKRLPILVLLVVAIGACSDAAVDPPTDSTPLPTTHSEGFPTIGPIRTGWIVGYDGRPMEITFEVHRGRAIFEGDIDVGLADSIPETREALIAIQGLKPRLGVVRDGVICNPTCGTYHWPGGELLYEIDPTLPNQARVTDAMAHIRANNPGVKFAPRGIAPNYVAIVPGDGCSSAVGRVGGRQTLTLAEGCGTGSTIHELLHALGMGHEQSRCDRDQFVEVLWQNIEAGREHNFNRLCDGYQDVLAYSEGSIMHYGTLAFSSNGQPTLRSLRGLDSLMGQRNGQGTSDIETVERMYSSLVVTVTGPTYSVGSTNTCQWTATISGGTPPYTYSWSPWVASPSAAFEITSGQGTANVSTYGHYDLANPPTTNAGFSLSGSDAAGRPYNVQRYIIMDNYPSGCQSILAATWTGPTQVGHTNTCQWTASATGGTPPYYYYWSASWTSQSTGFNFVSGQGTANASSYGYYYGTFPPTTDIRVSVGVSDAGGQQYYLERTITMDNYPSGCN